MIKHVDTDTVATETFRSEHYGRTISDAVAVTVASWWHSPSGAPLEVAVRKVSQQKLETLTVTDLEEITNLPAETWADSSDDPTANLRDLQALQRWAHERFLAGDVAEDEGAEA